MRSWIFFFALTTVSIGVGPAAGATEHLRQTTPTSPVADVELPAEGTPTADVAPVPLELPEIVAKVNGQPVNRGEFERAVRDVETRAGRPVPPDLRDVLYRQVLDRLVSYRLLAQESATREVTVPDAELDQRLTEVRQQYPSEQSFQQALTQRDVTLEELREETRLDMGIAKVVDTEILDLTSVGEQEISDFYTKNPAEFRQAEAVRASHILIRLEPDADEATRAQRRLVTEALLRRLKAGEAFAALARSHSHDRSGENGGDLGFISKGDLVPVIEETAFALGPGELSDIVESPFGFHIIQGGERRPARTVPLAEVSDRIRGYLEEQARLRETEAFIERLKARSQIEILI